MQLALLMLLGIGLILGPVAATIAGHPLGGVPTTMLIGTGVVLTIVSVVLIIITKLYVKTKANQAFVRTGMGGVKILQDGGAIVFPVIHEIVEITLTTIKLQVTRQGADALITLDKLRADIAAEFYVRVQPNSESIQAAARSFGAKMNDLDFVTRLVEDKLISALRTVAATKTLEGLNTERDEFIKQVTQIVAPDLAHNGLTLETATISKLDQTSTSKLNPDNIFDAQGLKTIAETTQKAKTETNDLVRAGELARTQRDVETRQATLAFELTQKRAEADQAASVVTVQAEKQSEGRRKAIEAERLSELADVDKAKNVEVAQLARSQATEVAEREKQAAVVAAEQKVEVANRDMESAVAAAEQKRALAQAERATAEAELESAKQKVLTVQVTSEADRAGQQQVIQATAAAQQKYVTTTKEADGAAYKVEKEAQGRKQAAEADAMAITTKADAESAAQKKKAEGAKAEQQVPVDIASAQVDVDKKKAMIPVDVAKQQVAVDKDRVETVLKPELEARDKNGAAAQQFELAKLQVTKEAEVRIASANAVAQVYGKITATVYGSPEDVAKVGAAVVSGISKATVIESFMGEAGPLTKAGLQGALKSLQHLVDSASDRLSGDVAVKSGEAPKADDK
jgi:flotillin